MSSSGFRTSSSWSGDGQSPMNDKDTRKHNETVLHNLKAGDLIQFPRGYYSHWAVYVGDEKVVHLAGDDNDGIDGKVKPEHVFTISGATFSKASVRVEEFWDVVFGCKAVINNAYDEKRRPLHPDEIVKNALSKMGNIGYSLISGNCEHFAKWCRYGVEKSDQVDNILTGVSVGMAAVLVVSAVGAFAKFFGSSPQTVDQGDSDDD